jgi:hypothetical protein
MLATLGFQRGTQFLELLRHSDSLGMVVSV